MFAEKMAAFMVEDGFSVLELCRFMRSRRADLLHGEMRELGVIQPVLHGSTKKDGLLGAGKRPQIPAGILKYFKTMNYSFGLWCAGHELEPDLACEMLSKDMISGDPDSERVHRAAMRDFPVTYRKIYNVEPLDVRWAGRQKAVNYSYAQAWDKKNERYVGRVREFLDTPEEPIGYGTTPEEALESVKTELRKKLVIQTIQKWIDDNTQRKQSDKQQ